MFRHIAILVFTVAFWGGFITGQSAFGHESKNWKDVSSSIVLVFQSQDTQPEIHSEDEVPLEEDNGPPNRFDKFLEPDPERAPPPEEVEKQLSGLGTGFWIDDKHVVTNYHVIKNMTKVELWMPHYPFPLKDVKIVGVDKSIDLAVLRVNTDIPHSVLKLATERAKVGDHVYAYGHGLSLAWSLTVGVISNNYRQSPQDSFVQYYQTDTVINPGNSGGPLINDDGEVIGVNVLIMSPTRFYIGYGYAIPSPLVKRVVDRIIETGSHKRPGVGIQMGAVEDEETYKILLEKGIESIVVVKELSDGMPAKDFGVKVGDIIVSINDKPVTVSGDLIESLWGFDPGDIIKLGVYRGDDIIYIEIPLVEIPAPTTNPFGR
tara:strand:- start:1051 stop:2175 length:1125 start_codon:yes stop_codon:yes gene_type:complete